MRRLIRKLPSVAVICSAIAFVGLNVADAWLTKQALDIGSREANPIVAPYGDNMLIKGLLALAIVVALVKFGKSKLLWVLNIGMLGVVLWNGIWLLQLS